MRKTKAFPYLLLAFCLILTGSLFSCQVIREYKGKEIASLTYETVTYMGGYTERNIIDFTENKYYSLAFLPFDEESPTEPELKKEFTEDAEKKFINACYSNGLFSLDDSYIATNVDDGGGWELIIEYKDGTKKISTGSNKAPYTIFNKCSTAFYDLCGEQVIGNLPSYYVYPPNISYSFHYKIKEENINVSSNILAQVERADYKWNKSLSTDNNIFAINEATKDKNKFVSDYTYQLVLYTANYDCKKRFNRITVKEYDYNAELSDEEVIYSGKWIKQVELDIELNKIYVYELSFSNGDYVQYTFSTYCPEK